MKVLVTGGAGFIGSHTAEALLTRGNSVVVVDEMNDYYNVRQKEENLLILCATAEKHGSRFKFYRADCSDARQMETIFAAERPDIICHLAARAGVRPSIADPFLYVQANVTGTVTMLEMAHRFKVKNFVYASSSSVYGSNTKVPFAESDPTEKPVSPYAATKKACELMAQTYHHLYGIPCTGLRFFTVYGPRGRPDMAPLMFVDKISRGVPINRFGDGSSSRDYTYIADIVSGILASIDNPHPCEVFNLGNSGVVRLSHFISVVEAAVGKKAVINVLPDQPGDVPTTFADLTKSARQLGYRPTTSIEAGIRKLVEWYAAQAQRRESGETASAVKGYSWGEAKVSPTRRDVEEAAVCGEERMLTPPPSPPLSEEMDTA
ncbi:hypothetical protein BDK51DRAFT_24884 [Blyttiomyces helicus]|uniref:NAD(P)-binding domain-containing protein n=1 Tax=Blyttiomyces helicus TaxID=388810 RepID=A0A4P9WAS6_9FUNG|nr:hypothetical protein BDK51DRAFT_24884 [Blyttiomyces helicus]|eukprot:RKO88675.1 hypothetical protein BDK51DRAFT_24884 [Blyttiomyces helicus]